MKYAGFNFWCSFFMLPTGVDQQVANDLHRLVICAKLITEIETIIGLMALSYSSYLNLWLRSVLV